MTIDKKKRNEIILVIGLLLLIFLLLFVNRVRFGGSAVHAQVSVNGQVVDTYSLNQDADVIIHGNKGGSNHLIIKDGGAAITEASCPDKVCVRQGIIKEAGEALVCLPNKVIVTLK